MSQDTIWYSDMSSSAGMSNWTKPSGNCEFRFVEFDLFCPTFQGDCFVQCEASGCSGGTSTNGYIYRIIPTTGYKDIYLEYTMCTFGDCRIYYNQNNEGDSNWIQFFSKNEQDQCDNPNTLDNKYYLPNSTDNNAGVGIKFEARDGVGDDCCSYEHVALKGTSTTHSPTTSEPTTTTPTTGSPTTSVPTDNPSKNPTTGSPTTLVPTYIPTSVPITSIPTSIPSMNPTYTPTSVPVTSIPSYNPSNNPTQSPTSTAKVPTLGFGSPTITLTVSTPVTESISTTGLTAITDTKLTKTINTPNEQSISIFIYLGVGVGVILCILNAILCVIFAIKRKKKQKQKNNLTEQKSIMMVSTDVLQIQKPQALNVVNSISNINTNGANNLSIAMDDDVDDIRNDVNISDDIELIGNIRNDDTPSTNEDNIVTKGNIDGYNDNINTESEGTGTQSPTDDIMVFGKRNTFGNMVDDEFIVNDDSDDNINVTSQKTLGKIQSDEFIINGDNDDDDLIVCINDTTTSRQ